MYVFCTLSMIAIEFFSKRFSLPMLDMFSYINPLVIVSSVSILFVFSQIKLKSKIINWVASSCFAVFLIHTNVNLCVPYYKAFVNYLYANYDGLLCVGLLFVFIAVVFVCSIFLDQIRKLFWNVINARFSN